MADTIFSRVRSEARPGPKPPPSSESVEPIWQPTQAAPKREIVVVIPVERELIDALCAPVDPEDGHWVGNQKRERALVALFDRLSSGEAFALCQRLANPKSDDALATAFAKRVSVDRRKVLLAYLGSPKRRAALGR